MRLSCLAGEESQDGAERRRDAPGEGGLQYGRPPRDLRLLRAQQGGFRAQRRDCPDQLRIFIAKRLGAGLDLRNAVADFFASQAPAEVVEVYEGIVGIERVETP